MGCGSVGGAATKSRRAKQSIINFGTCFKPLIISLCNGSKSLYSKFLLRVSGLAVAPRATEELALIGLGMIDMQ